MNHNKILEAVGLVNYSNTRTDIFKESENIESEINQIIWESEKSYCNITEYIVNECSTYINESSLGDKIHNIWKAIVAWCKKTWDRIVSFIKNKLGKDKPRLAGDKNVPALANKSGQSGDDRAVTIRHADNYISRMSEDFEKVVSDVNKIVDLDPSGDIGASVDKHKEYMNMTPEEYDQALNDILNKYFPYVGKSQSVDDFFRKMDNKVELIEYKPSTPVNPVYTLYCQAKQKMVKALTNPVINGLITAAGQITYKQEDSLYVKYLGMVKKAKSVIVNLGTKICKKVTEFGNDLKNAGIIMEI